MLPLSLDIKVRKSDKSFFRTTKDGKRSWSGDRRCREWKVKAQRVQRRTAEAGRSGVQRKPGQARWLRFFEASHLVTNKKGKKGTGLRTVA